MSEALKRFRRTEEVPSENNEIIFILFFGKLFGHGKKGFL